MSRVGVKARGPGGMNAVVDPEVHWQRTKLAIYRTLTLVAVAVFILVTSL